MKVEREVSAALVAAVITGACWLGPAMSADAVSTREGSGVTAPVALRGELPRGVQEVTVAVDLRRPDGDAAPGDTVATHYLDAAAVTYAQGRFTVSVDPASLPPAALDRSGVATFIVTSAAVKGSSWTTVTSAQALVDAEGRTVWTDPLSAVSWDAMSGARRQRWLPHVDSVLPDVGVALDPLTKAAVRTEGTRTDRQASRSADDCQPHVVDTRRVWATIGTTYPIGASTAWMNVNSSQGASYGVAVSTAGGFKASGTKKISGGWGFEWNALSNSRSYQKEVLYEKRRYYSTDCPKKYTDFWFPVLETGGVDENVGIPRPSWHAPDKCVDVIKGTWHRWRSDGHAYTYGDAVKFKAIIGIDLGIERQYSDSQMIVYDIKGGKPKEMCGDNAVPSVSSKQMEWVK